jgi:hypothetical protein
VGTGSVAVGACGTRRVRSLLAISACLAVGLLLMTPGAAHGISGYSSNVPAVAAQYPDSPALSPLTPQPVVSNLAQVTVRTRKTLRSPKVKAQVRTKERVIARKTTHAIATAAGLGAPQSGSIALLVAGIGVVALGAFLRWRRGRTQY